MKARLTPRESFTLYGIGIAAVFGFFVLGLYWGSGGVTGSTPARAETPDSSSEGPRVAPSSARLDFRTTQGTVVAKQEPESQPGSTAETREVTPPVAGQAKENLVPDSAAEQPNIRPGQATGAKSHFSIQVGALNTEEEARKVLMRLETRGYTGILDKPAGADRYYRVRVGMYENRDAAQRAEALLKSEGFLTFIKKIETGTRAY